MKLKDFKIGDIILKEEGSRDKLFGPVEFFAYEHGLLFCAPVQMPDTFIEADEFLEKVKTIQIEGSRVFVYNMSNEDDDWFTFPAKTLGKVRAYIAMKYPDRFETPEPSGSVMTGPVPKPSKRKRKKAPIPHQAAEPEITEEQAEDLRPPKIPPRAPVESQPPPGSKPPALPEELPQSDQVDTERSAGMIG